MARLGVLIFVLACCWVTQAAADDVDQQAKKAFKQGVSLFEAESYAEAADAFRRAHALKPTWSLMFNIGQSEAAARRYGLAHEAFETYLSLGGDEISSKRREEVLKELERLFKMTGSIEVVALTGCEVVVDEIKRGTVPLPGKIRVAIGVVHEVEIVLDGTIIDTQSVKVSRGEVKRIEVTSPEQGGDPPFIESDDSSEGDEQPVDGAKPAHSTKKIAGIAALAAGGALLAGAAATGSIALVRNNELKSRCTDGVCPEAERDYGESRRLLALGTDLMLGFGIAAAAAGTVLLILSKRDGKERADEMVSITPMMGRGLSGMAISGRF